MVAVWPAKSSRLLLAVITRGYHSRLSLAVITSPQLASHSKLTTLTNHAHAHGFDDGGMFVFAIQFLNRVAEVKIGGAFGDA